MIYCIVFYYSYYIICVDLPPFSGGSAAVSRGQELQQLPGYQAVLEGLAPLPVKPKATFFAGSFQKTHDTICKFVKEPAKKKEFGLPQAKRDNHGLQ